MGGCCCSFKATPESKRAPKSNGCHGSSQVQQKQGPREMATKRSSSSQSQVVLKAIFLFHFHFCHPAQSRPSMAENRAGGDEEPADAVLAVVVGATCPPLPLVRPPPYRRVSTGKTTWLKRSGSLVIRARHESLRLQIGWAPWPLFSSYPAATWRFTLSCFDGR